VAEWRQRPWRKLRRTFVSSVKLRRVGPHALALLAAMTADAWWDDESQEGRMYESEGVPMKIDDVYALAQLTPAQGRVAWGKLADKRIVDIVDGIATLVRYRKSQRSDAAERMRAARSRTSSEHVQHASGTTANSVTDIECRVQKTEEDTPVVPKGTTPPDPIVAHVLAAMREACVELGGRGPQDNPANRKLIARISSEVRATAEDWTRVIRAQLQSVRGEPKNHRYLALSTLCVPANFLRILDAPAGKPATPGVQRFDATPEQLHREQADRLAAIAAEESA
jgi:hypothetical protein